MVSTICVSYVSSEDTHYFVTAKDKTGGMNTARVDGITKDLVLEYLSRYCIHPAPSLFCNQKHPARRLTSERIARLCLGVMEEVGVDMHIFRPHGTTTTFLLSLGIDKRLVQSRGQWSSELCIDRYYSRLHDHIPWDCPLGVLADITHPHHSRLVIYRLEHSYHHRPVWCR